MVGRDIGVNGIDGRNSRESESEENANNSGNLNRRVLRKGDLRNFQNPKLIPLGSKKDLVVSKMGQSSSRGGKESNWASFDECLVSLGQKVEQSPLLVLEGKKRQRVSKDVILSLEKESNGIHNVKSGGSARQSSRKQ